jgi:carotenoid cleavage dioxygenase-like enzyme
MPGSIEEDQGVLLAIVLDIKRAASFLVVLEAKNLQELGRAEVPLKIPAGLHGEFFER